MTDSIRYDAFGNVVNRTGTTPTPFGFVGKAQYQTDGDSGLLLLGHRYYDPSIGRFLSQDPIQDGTNWYAYCDNNPLTDTDPEGLSHTKGARKSTYSKHTERRSDDPEKKDDRMKFPPPKKAGQKAVPKGGRNRAEPTIPIDPPLKDETWEMTCTP